MKDWVIRVNGLGKQYQIGAKQARYSTLRERLSAAFTRPFRRLMPSANQLGTNDRYETIWALKDVSFEVQEGEVLGVIGRNGVGKSTLLKILSRITEPTEGHAEIRGRVGSLLEVGTGFHSELTGRENIYLNGAILGMKKKEITRKFEEIAAFAEVDKFIDTPVKHYSSGMYMRLAFSVAAHLETEILLVDEVLAVGDAAFQRKCLGKMGEVAKAGRTVLFVSHNMAAVSNFCDRGILLESGRISVAGGITEVVSSYIAQGRASMGECSGAHLENHPGNNIVQIKKIRILSDGVVTGDVRIDRDTVIEIEYLNRRPGAYLSAGIHLLDQLGNAILATANMASVSSTYDEWAGRPYPEGIFKSFCRIPPNFLNEGRYSVTVVILLNNSAVQVRIDQPVSFTVHETGEMRKEFMGKWIGVVRPKLEWHTELQGVASSR